MLKFMRVLPELAFRAFSFSIYILELPEGRRTGWGHRNMAEIGYLWQVTASSNA